MKVTLGKTPEALIPGLKVFGDERGLFIESFAQRAFRNVLCRLYYLIKQSERKLIRAIPGGVFDVAVGKVCQL